MVETIDQIETTFTLGEHYHTQPEDVIFKEEESCLSVLKSRSCSSVTCDIHVSAKLAALLNIEVDHVLTLLSQDEGTVNAIMRMKGIPEIIASAASDAQLATQYDGDGKLSRADGGQGTTLDTKKARQNSGMASIIRTAQMHREAQLSVHESGDKAISSATDPQRQIVSGSAYDSKDEISVDSSRKALNVDSFDLVRDAAAKSSIALGITTECEASRIIKNYCRSPTRILESGMNIVQPAGNSERPPKRRDPVAVLELLQAQDRQETNQVQLTETERHNFGVLGELYVRISYFYMKKHPMTNVNSQVYALLSKELPHFSSDNWTSELRGEVPGFEPYPAGSLADFTYRDTSGALTTLLFGKEKHEFWKNHWPTYYLEVKSTPGDIEEPFHMSRRQLQIVRTSFLILVLASLTEYPYRPLNSQATNSIECPRRYLRLSGSQT